MFRSQTGWVFVRSPPMFESLIASTPQARIRAHRYVLSASCHLLLVGGAVALTGHRNATTHARPVDPGMLFLAPQPAHELPAPPRHNPRSHPNAAAPSWQPSVPAPELSPPPLPSGVPTVAELLQGADLSEGSSSGLSALSPAGVSLATIEPFSAAAVDDPVETLEQPAPEYPSALSHAGVFRATRGLGTGWRYDRPRRPHHCEMKVPSSVQ